MKWTKETPTKDGWYWAKWKDGMGIHKSPCYVFHNGEEVLVKFSRGHFLFEGPRHGGPGLKGPDGVIVKSLRFGPEIIVPE